MIQIRQNIFETNSSSVHSITLCTEDEFQKWKNGKILFDRDECRFVTPEQFEEFKSSEYYNEEYDHDRGLTYNQFFDWQGDDSYLDYMEKYQKHEKINGVDIVAFGYYGHD